MVSGTGVTNLGELKVVPEKGTVLHSEEFLLLDESQSHAVAAALAHAAFSAEEVFEYVFLHLFQYSDAVVFHLHAAGICGSGLKDE